MGLSERHRFIGGDDAFRFIFYYASLWSTYHEPDTV